MKTTSLDDYLKQIEPLPWTDYDPAKKFATDNAYALHASNALPALVDALDGLRLALLNDGVTITTNNPLSEAALDKAVENMKAALAAAQTVKTP